MSESHTSKLNSAKYFLPSGAVPARAPVSMNLSTLILHCIYLGRVAENEKIYRNIDDDEEKYSCPNDFVPVFSDQALASLDGELRQQAEAVCGNDVTCLFDIAATRQVAFGQSTLEESTAIKNEIADIGTFYNVSLLVFYSARSLH